MEVFLLFRLILMKDYFCGFLMRVWERTCKSADRGYNAEIYGCEVAREGRVRF